MSVDFTAPEWLATLGVLPLLAYYFFRSLVDLPRAQRVVSLSVRSVICALLTLVLAGLTLVTPTDEVFVVFAIDRSLSVDNDSAAAADEFVRTAVAATPDGRFTVLPFAAEPAHFSAVAPVKKPEPQPPTETAPAPSPADDPTLKGTNLQAAIEVAAAAIPPDFVPRIVLLSDGRETSGDSLRAALQSRLRIDTYPLKTRDEPEIQLADVQVPAQVAQGEPFYVDVQVNSNHDDEVEIEVFKGEHRILAARKPIQAGENQFRFQQQTDRQTEYAVRIHRPRDESGSLVADKFRDTLLDNNAASGLVFAAGKPRVLLIDSHPELAQSLEWALQEEGLLVDTRPPQGMPDDLSDLQNYEALILSNVPATVLSQRKMEVIRTYVSDLGGGFIMLGGDQSFGLGGYYKTVIEDVLPVRSDFEKEKEKPSLAMMIVVDKSGSMGGDKIELAKDAAKAAVELLGNKDQVGVIAFDGQSYLVSELISAAQKGLVIDRISTIEAGGGTSIYPAMEDAYNALNAASAKLKHVILLTDGYSSPGDFEGITRSMVAARMTVSTVGVGDPDKELLEQIAETGNGRYYFTDDPSSIPQIFAKETMTAGKSAINEQPFLPQVIRATPVLAELALEEAPFLLGYVVTRPKPTSEVILVSEAGDPVLSWWRYGLGMSVAFTSDAKSRWAAEWLTWPGYSKFWAQIVRHCMRKSDTKGVLVDVQRLGNSAHVKIDVVDPNGQFINAANAQLTVIDPRLGEQQIAVPQTAPGRYETDLPLPLSGSWQLQARLEKDGQLLHQQSRGLVVGYPDELQLLPANEALLKSLSQSTGGRYDVVAAEVFRRDPAETACRTTSLWPWLLTAAICLFVVDVALRRIDFSLFTPQPLLRRSRKSGTVSHISANGADAGNSGGASAASRAFAGTSRSSIR